MQPLLVHLSFPKLSKSNLTNLVALGTEGLGQSFFLLELLLGEARTRSGDQKSDLGEKFDSGIGFDFSESVQRLLRWKRSKDFQLTFFNLALK